MPSRQEDQLNAETTWFHTFRTMFTSGDVKKIGPYAFTVYSAIKSYTNFRSGESFPKIETLMDVTGVSRSQVKRVLVDLAKLGYLSVTKKGRQNHYTLREKVVIQDAHGRPTAVATWDYLPSSVQESVAEIKNVLVTGDFNGAKIVSIQHLTVNVNNGNGTQVNIDMSRATDEATRDEIKSIIRQAAQQSAEIVVIHDPDEHGQFQQ
jgi:DNA-binding transcriptional MocR family regulator